MQKESRANARLFYLLILTQSNLEIKVLSVVLFRALDKHSTRLMQIWQNL
jgi:hypothetical protein